MIRLYVAGPMTGLPDNNYPAFNQAANKLRVHGYKVENPADNEASLQKILHHHPIEYTDYLRAGLTQLLHCDGVAVLEDWWLSGGARWEVQTAGILRMPVRPVGEWLAFPSPGPVDLAAALLASFEAAKARRAAAAAAADPVPDDLTERCIETVHEATSSITGVHARKEAEQHARDQEISRLAAQVKETDS